MQNIKVGCIPVRQAINVSAKSYKIKKFFKNNKIGLIIASIAIILLSTYAVLIINFIKLLNIIY